MKTSINHLNTWQQALFLLLVNGGSADIKVKFSWGWVLIKNASLECVGQQYYKSDGTIETNVFVYRDYVFVHYDDGKEGKIAMDFPSRFTMENVLSSENHSIS